MGLYWELGGYISRKIASAEWGDGVVDELAATIAKEYPGQRGFTRPNLFRMRQFFEAYQGDAKVSALLRQIAADPSPAHSRSGQAGGGAQVLPGAIEWPFSFCARAGSLGRGSTRVIGVDFLGIRRPIVNDAWLESTTVTMPSCSMPNRNSTE